MKKSNIFSNKFVAGENRKKDVKIGGVSKKKAINLYNEFMDKHYNDPRYTHFEFDNFADLVEAQGYTKENMNYEDIKKLIEGDYNSNYDESYYNLCIAMS